MLLILFLNINIEKKKRKKETSECNVDISSRKDRYHFDQFLYSRTIELGRKKKRKVDTKEERSCSQGSQVGGAVRKA